MAALIAWMLVVRVGNLVKDGAISAVTRVFDALWRRRLRRASILDKSANTNRVLSMRSRPLSGPSQRRKKYPGGDAGVLSYASTTETLADCPLLIRADRESGGSRSARAGAAPC